MSTALETPVTDEGWTQYLVDVAHRLNQSLKQSILRHIYIFLCLFDVAIATIDFHGELAKEIHHILNFCRRHVPLLADEKSREDQLLIILEAATTMHLWKLRQRVVMLGVHRFITVIKYLLEPLSGNFYFLKPV